LHGGSAGLLDRNHAAQYKTPELLMAVLNVVKKEPHPIAILETVRYNNWPLY
jgi:hypothetical protein